jgi:alpha-galactosidase
MNFLHEYLKNLPQLRYIQIDDGYQSKMGDWLETGNAFGGNIQNVLKQIKSAGFEPAIWVAPFIAEKDSLVFQQHPDWFVKGEPRPSKGRRAFSTWNYFSKDSPLLPAGLLGPVVLRTFQETPL